MAAILIAAAPAIPAEAVLERIRPPDQAMAGIAARAKDALGEGDARVYVDVGMGYRRAPGLRCATPADMDALKSRGGRLSSDLIDPSHPEPATPPLAAMVAYNRAVATSPGFQRATRCRPQTPCEFRFETPDIAWWIGAAPPTATVGTKLDRRCLDEPAQLSAVAARGSGSDLKILLAHAPTRWRARDPSGRDAYDRALISAAGAVRPQAVKLLLTRLTDSQRTLPTGERVLERAMLAGLEQPDATDADRLAIVTALLDAGGRTEFDRDGLRISLLAEVSKASLSLDGVSPLVGLLLDRGADPNGPACAPGRESAPPPLYWALGNEQLFDRLTAAGATPRGHACQADRDKPTLTATSVRELTRSTPSEARRRATIKLLRAGGRIGPMLQGLPITDLSPAAASIIVAAHELSGQRDALLRDLVSRAQAPGARIDAETRAALIRWSTCPHGPPVLKADHAELCQVGDTPDTDSRG